LGAGIEIDDNAIFRHPDLTNKKEDFNESQLKTEADKFGISFYQLEGKIGCIVNSSALVFAIEDVFSSLNSHLALILDVGCGAGDEKISASMELQSKNKKIETIIIAMFGGLTPCDLIA
jgi:succinyl-CoA synthetase beta subunit